MLILAPMAGITSMPFRKLCKKHGADLVYSEMISANALYQKPVPPLISEKERPLTLQVFGDNKEKMVSAVNYLNSFDFDFLDLNCGCPVPKVVGKDAGGGMLRNPEKLFSMLEVLLNHSNKPVTIKLRLGFNDYNYESIVKQLNDYDLHAVAIHARTVKQGYSGKADWEAISKSKEISSHKIYGNGDVFSPEDAKKMFEETNCDGVMIGRAAMGNPSIFSRTKHFLETGELTPEPSLEETLNEFFIFAEEFVSLGFNYSELKSHALWFLKGFPNSHKTKVLLARAKSFEEMKEILLYFQAKSS